MTEYIFNFDVNSAHGIAHMIKGETKVNVIINRAMAKAKDCDMSFDKFLSSCISHEVIHIILERDVSNETSAKFDNICYRKNKNFKQWFGGMA